MNGEHAQRIIGVPHVLQHEFADRAAFDFQERELPRRQPRARGSLLLSARSCVRVAGVQKVESSIGSVQAEHNFHIVIHS